MQASTNTQELPGRRAGRRKLLAVSAALVMALAALLLSLALSSSMEPSNAAVQKKMPYTFFFTHYQLLGDPNNPVAPHGTVVRLHPRPPAATSAFAHAIWALRRVAPQTSTTPPSTNDDL